MIICRAPRFQRAVYFSTRSSINNERNDRTAVSLYSVIISYSKNTACVIRRSWIINRISSRSVTCNTWGVKGSYNPLQDTAYNLQSGKQEGRRLRLP